MQHQRSLTPAEQDAIVDQAILGLLLDGEIRGPWSVDEVAREIGDRVDTIDSLARLHRAGLVHRLGDFVFATRAAVAFATIAR